MYNSSGIWYIHNVCNHQDCLFLKLFCHNVREFVISSVLSHCNKNLKWRTDQPLDGPVLQLSDGLVLQFHVTTQFYLESKGKIHPQGMRACLPKRLQEKRGPWPSFGSSFYMFFLFPLGLPYVNWASQECCLFYLRSSLRSLGLALFYFPRLFPSLSFSHRHSGLLFRILTT